MFGTMMVLLFTGQRVFGVIGFVGSAAALWLWGQGAFEMPFNASFQVLNWYPLITVPFFVFMGYMLSESGMASNLYRLFHVWFGPVRGGLALGTIGLMVLIAALNGLSVAGMAIGATIALPQLLRHGYDKVMVTGVIQAGSSLGILIPPSVVLVLYAMIARQPVLDLWLAGVGPGLLMAVVFAAYVYIRCLVRAAPGSGCRHRPGASRRGARRNHLGRKILAAARRPAAGRHLRHHDGAVHDRHDQPGRKLGRRRCPGDDCGLAVGEPQPQGLRGIDAQHAVDKLHVPLDHPRRALLQLRL